MRTVAVLALVAVLQSGCSQQSSTATWRGREFRAIRTLGELPEPVQKRLGAGTRAMEGMADAGQPFNHSDMIMDDRLPTRRFALGARSGDVCVVAFERGGYAYGVEVVLFETPTSPPTSVARPHDIPTSVEALMALLPK